MELQNKTILVTGASSGIGRAIAIACAKQGATVLINYRNNDTGAQETLAEVEKVSQGKLYQADLSEKSAVAEMFAAIDSDGITLDMLINNAGDADGSDMDDYAMWEHQWKNILMNTVMVSNEFIAQIENNQNIHKIINITSLYGEFEASNEDLSQYSAMKAAMNSFTLSLAKKYAPNILVNAVAPGYTWTPAWEGVEKNREKEIINSVPIKRFITAEEIAHAVIMLLENDALTGEILHVDGGKRLVQNP